MPKKLDDMNLMILINEETEWQAYIPRGKNEAAIIHSWYPKRRYFKKSADFIKWAKKELDV